MIGTICFIADFDTENFLNEFKVEASEKFHVGVTGGNVPRHISLGMPYHVPDWDAYISYAEKFAKTLKPVTVTMDKMLTACFPRPDLGAFVVSFKEDFGLDEIRKKLTENLKKELNIEVKDNLIGKRNIALGCGTKSIDAYNEYVKSVDPARYKGKSIRFDQIGVFYYPSENWDPSTYICYRRIKLS
ncbi:MAG: hypothetical protein HUK24_07755 [Sphaerochaetaceae bacterium]|nr:hypothetical protein [Sphaerochaetaceae bacterium]